MVRDVPPRDRVFWFQRDGARERRRSVCGASRQSLRSADPWNLPSDALSILLEYYGAQDLQGACEFLAAVASVGLPPLPVPHAVLNASAATDPSAAQLRTPGEAVQTVRARCRGGERACERRYAGARYQPGCHSLARRKHPGETSLGCVEAGVGARSMRMLHFPFSPRGSFV